MFLGERCRDKSSVSGDIAIKRSSSAGRRIRTILLVIYDLIAVNAAFFLALWFRFDCRYSMIPEEYLDAWLHFVPVYSAVCLIVFAVLKLYQSIWRFASYTEIYRVINATVITCLFHFVVIILFFHRMPVSYYIIGTFFQFFFLIGVRFVYRLILLLHSYQKHSSGLNRSRVMLIGAGSAGRLILRDMMYSETVKDRICCIIDDDPDKWGKSIEGVEIVGGRDEIMACVDRYQIEKIYLAIPSATPEQRRDILNICS